MTKRTHLLRTKLPKTYEQLEIQPGRTATQTTVIYITKTGEIDFRRYSRLSFSASQPPKQPPKLYGLLIFLNCPNTKLMYENF